MPRSANIFFNLVTDENSTTELFCNLLRFSAFRVPFLRMFLPEEIAIGVSWEDFETQADLGTCGRPDMQVMNPDVAVLIEVKVTPGLAPTANQPRGYLNFLRKQNAGECCLIFLVPRRWMHLDSVKRDLAGDSPRESGRSVRSQIISWEEVVELIEENDLATLNPFINDFYELLRARLGARSVSFTVKEILMLFSNEIPTALSHLQQVVDGVRDLSSTHIVKPSASRSLCPSESTQSCPSERHNRRNSHLILPDGAPRYRRAARNWPDSLQRTVNRCLVVAVHTMLHSRATLFRPLRNFGPLARASGVEWRQSRKTDRCIKSPHCTRLPILTLIPQNLARIVGLKWEKLGA